jgi:hypothetical protein
MESIKHRVVTYLSKEYKRKLEEFCEDREEKEARAVREIIKQYFDTMKVGAIGSISKTGNNR